MRRRVFLYAFDLIELAGTTNVNVAAELPAPAPNPVRAAARYLGPGALS